MTNEVKNVPELRFPGFEDEWKEKKLGTIFTVTMGQSPNSTNYTDNPNDTILVQGNADIYKGKIWPRIYTKEITKLLERNDIILSVRAPVGEIGIAQVEACIGRGVCSIKGNKFLYYFLDLFKKQNRWSRFSQGSTFESISGKDIRDLKFYVCNSEEQNKIGEFFNKLDRQIELEEEKLELLEQQKRGYMQQIFSQELRFKDEDGNIYPDWKEYVLGETGNTYSGLSSKTKEDFGYGDSYFITYMNVFNNTIAKANMIEKVNIQENEKQNKVNYKDILFTTSSEVPEETGMSSIWLYKESNVYLNSFCFGFRVTCDDIEPIYLTRFLRSEKMRKQITILSQGSTRFNISKKEVMKLKIDVPNLEEQTKIVNFLSKYDSLIESQSNKIDLLKERKNGFLQKMFV